MHLIIRSHGRIVYASNQSNIYNISHRQRLVTYSERLIALRKKAYNIKEQIVGNSDPQAYEELMTSLQNVNQDIKDHLKDHLSLDFCLEEPWSPECKYFD